MLRLPTFSDDHYSYRVTLEGRTYRVRLQFNRRTAGWYISLYASDDTALVMGVRVVCNYPLFGSLRDERLPLGTIFAVSLTNDDSDPGRDDLGQRVRLLYLDAADRAVLDLVASHAASADALTIAVAGGEFLPG